MKLVYSWRASLPSGRGIEKAPCPALLVALISLRWPDALKCRTEEGAGQEWRKRESQRMLDSLTSKALHDPESRLTRVGSPLWFSGGHAAWHVKPALPLAALQVSQQQHLSCQTEAPSLQPAFGATFVLVCVIKPLACLHSFQVIRVMLEWRALNYTVVLGRGKKKHSKTILSDISASMEPGRLLAVMGVYGASDCSAPPATSLDVPASPPQPTASHILACSCCQ